MTGKNPGCQGMQQNDPHAKQDAEIKERLAHIKRKLLVMSGKGGVGKSSVSALLALSLAQKGYRVGLMDVDFHGPSIPRLLGLSGSLQPAAKAGKAKPIPFLPNLEVISIEVLLGEDKDIATIWRGPVKLGVIKQFIADIEWDRLDYLIIDSPPGTGDEPLTVAQTIPDAQALIVTTPQEISLADVRKSINFCRQVKMGILGIVENMGAFECPHCGKPIDLFKSRGGELLAQKENLKLLASLPFYSEVVQMGDAGSLSRLVETDHPFMTAFGTLVQEVEGTASLVAQPAAPPEAAPGMEPISVNKEDKKEQSMDKKIFAVPVSDGKLCSHFGHCDQFALISTENGTIKETQMQTPPPHEPGVLPRWLHEQGAHVIIAGGMGSRAQDLFNQNGITVVTGAPVEAPEALVARYLENSLETGANVCDH